MPTQRQIDRFTLAFHARAIERLRSSPELRDQALAVLDRWEAAGASESGQKYRDAWRMLLTGHLADLQHAVCADDETAATLRSMSPLGFVLGEAERLQLRQEAMSA
jgi:hypothetical protein